jgi:hypothetical protein
MFQSYFHLWRLVRMTTWRILYEQLLSAFNLQMQGLVPVDFQV